MNNLQMQQGKRRVMKITESEKRKRKEKKKNLPGRRQRESEGFDHVGREENDCSEEEVTTIYLLRVKGLN